MYFAVQPKKAVVNDFNEQLVNVYKQLQTNPEDVLKYLEKLQNKYNSFKSDTDREKLYYDTRTKFNELIQNNVFSAESAAFVIFLNKAGYNGLYRVNSKGGYNVPWSKRKKLNAYKRRIVELVKLISQHKVFVELLKLELITNSVIIDKKKIVEIMKESDLYNIDSDVTYERRASTVSGWCKWVLSQIEDFNNN